MNPKSTKILFTGGGTGGHVMPLIAVIREVKKLDTDHKLALHYIGPKNEDIAKEGLKTHHIAAGKLRRYFSFRNFIDILFVIPFSFLQSFFLLLMVRPKLVFSKGGTGALPVTFWAHLFSIPIFIHESDSFPGSSNAAANRWAQKIFTAFEYTELLDPRKITWVGNPIRQEILEGDPEKAKEIFGLTYQRPVILVWGGSQGSEPINNFILEIAHDLLKKYEVIHVAGQKNFQRVQIVAQGLVAKEQKSQYHLYASLNQEEVAHALKAADLVVSRSGASSVFEIAAAGKPSILIPLPSAAGDHQVKNAYQYARTNAAVVLEQNNLTEDFFIEQIEYLLSKADHIKHAAKAFAKPEAARTIAQEIIDFITTSK